MASIWVAGDPVKDPSKNHNQRDITTQIVISIALGIFAFLAFCVSALFRSISLYQLKRQMLEQF